jgi:hypothetical protein
MGNDLFKQKAAVIQPREETREGQEGWNSVVNPLYAFLNQKVHQVKISNRKLPATLLLRTPAFMEFGMQLLSVLTPVADV